MKQVTFVFTVNATSDSASEHPRYAYFQVTQGFIDRLDELCGVLKDYNLSEVREFSGPEYEDKDEHRLDSHELVVTPNFVWFRATVKDADCDVETIAISPSTFDEQWEKSANNAVVFVGEDGDKEDAIEWFHEAFAELDT
jgi:hypothetical protein